MDWARHYDVLVTRARERQLLCYTEKHHVVPRCLGGSNSKSNIVKLTPEEHYVAHLLLTKMYPERPSLVFAVSRMRGNKGNATKTNKLFGIARKWHAETARKLNTGLIRSDETRRRISEAKKGKKLNLNEEQLKRHIAIRTGVKHSEESKMKRAVKLKGRVFSDESIAKMRASQVARRERERIST